MRGEAAAKPHAVVFVATTATAALARNLVKRLPVRWVRTQDIMFFLTQAYTSFVCKVPLTTAWLLAVVVAVLSYPHVAAASHKALEALIERMTRGPSDPFSNPIVVFPEGTTTNGRCLIRFRRGAFAALQPVQPCVLIYTPGCLHLAYEVIPSAYFMSLALSAWPASELRAYWLPPMGPPPAEQFASEDERVNAFACQVRNAMWKVLKEKHYAAAKFEGSECSDTWDGNGRIRRECINALFRSRTEEMMTKKHS
ncbi:acyltransferase domain-containing protein [Cyclospora cayetanensis]|uniref:Acyltransferase domain-containing protein n=1 Tax=Cyclospora cayetanensis TaxID=88456 RepID=A0A1D3CXN6_9EIME|nr:acyltransferase domain-containing protein [Cyclospora cayetanensis]